MNITIGMRVTFKNAAGTGTVVAVRGAEVDVEDAHGFVYAYGLHEVMPERLMEMGGVDAEAVGRLKGDAPCVAGSDRSSGARRKERLILDLHSHELLESTAGMSKYDILKYQLEKTVQVLAEAQRSKISRVLIVHGKGSGRLRDEVHGILSKRRNLEYYFADLSEGGHGATEVRIISFG